MNYVEQCWRCVGFWGDAQHWAPARVWWQVRWIVLELVFTLESFICYFNQRSTFVCMHDCICVYYMHIYVYVYTYISKCKSVRLTIKTSSPVYLSFSLSLAEFLCPNFFSCFCWYLMCLCYNFFHYQISTLYRRFEWLVIQSLWFILHWGELWWGWVF